MPRFRCCPRSLVAALLVLSTSVGLVEAHEASERLEQERWFAGLAPEVCHPDLPAHFEPTPDPEAHCPACLLRLIGRGASFGRSHLGSALVALGSTPRPAARVVAAVVLPQPISRGPPAA